MCFTCQMGFEPEASNQFGSKFLIILTLDPNGMARAIALRGPRGLESGTPLHQRGSRRGEAKTAASGREALAA